MPAARTLVVAVACVVAGLPARGSADTESELQRFLYSGRLAEGRAWALEQLKTDRDNDTLLFGLALVEAAQAAEEVTQTLYRFGMRQPPMMMMFMGPLPQTQANPNPEPIRYEDFRGIVETLLKRLEQVEQRLAAIDGDFKLRLALHSLRLDADGDGEADMTSLGQLLQFPEPEPGEPPLELAADRTDAEWLRAYVHLLMAGCEFFLAYDASELFHHCAHLWFARPETRFPFLKWENEFSSFVDLIAAVHLWRFPLAEPQRTERALAHLEQTIRHSRRMFELAEQETDDDQEWIPSARQQTILPEANLSPEMIATWREFLAEAELLLAGKRLAPFWRPYPDHGLNLRRVFTEPRELDIVLWVQGTAAAPYLEKGELTDPETWTQFNQVFRGNFIGFALWIN